MRHCDVLVVGGGITGCSAAWHLVNFGADVVLIEKGDLNAEASGRNAGSLHGQIQHSAFVERGEDWGRGFLPSLQFLVGSLEIWKSLSSLVGLDLEVSLKGGLLVAETEAHMRDIERKVAIERTAGVESDLLDRSDLQAIAPYISDSMFGGQLCRLEGKVNSLLAAPALAREARRLGARIETNTLVQALDHESGRFVIRTDRDSLTADRVILAAGNGINRFSAAWGDPLPLIEEPVQVGVTERIEPLVDFLVYFAGGKLTFKQAKTGSLLIGGGWRSEIDPVTGFPRVNSASLISNMEVAMRVVPALAGVQLIRTWAGVGLATPDLAPVIGELGPRGLILGVFPHLGLTAGPLLGRVLAQLAIDREPEVSIAPFSPNRF